jgi:hypothetical protein
MLQIVSSQSSKSSTDATSPREIAIARTLLSLLEGSLAAADVRSAADVAQQLAEHLRKIGGHAA